jgi:hypothetical protein
MAGVGVAANFSRLILAAVRCRRLLLSAAAIHLQKDYFLPPWRNVLLQEAQL